MAKKYSLCFNTYMKILPVVSVSNRRLVSFSSKSGNVKYYDEDNDKIYRDEYDVRKNFTCKIDKKDTKAPKILNGVSKIKGKVYGQDYELYRKSKGREIAIIGRIGDKKVEIMSPKKRGIFHSSIEMEGYIGEKPIKIKEEYKFFRNGTEISINLGNKKINIMSTHFIHDQVFVGKDIDMKLMYYVEGRSEFMGKFGENKDLLPILAALYKYI